MVSYILEIIANFILAVITKIGYWGIFLLMFLQSFNVPIPSEITMPFSGFLTSPASPLAGRLSFWLVVFAGAFGNLAGALLSYKFAGILVKNGLREKWVVLKLLLDKKHLEIAQKWFVKYGSYSIFFGRLMPVVSTFISFPAGLAKMNLLKFSFLTFAGSFCWSFILTKLGFIFGENWQSLQGYFRKFDYVIIVLIIGGGIWWLWMKLENNKN